MSGAEPDYNYEERVAIMIYDGGLSRGEAERLARQRPWDTVPYWRMTLRQTTLFDGTRNHDRP